MKVFSCGCMRHVANGILGSWKWACDDHLLARLMADKRKAFPKPSNDPL